MFSPSPSFSNLKKYKKVNACYKHNCAPPSPYPRERSLCSCPPLPEGGQPLFLPAPTRGSAAFAPAKPCPRGRSLFPCPPPPEGTQPFAPVLSYSDISVMDKTICFCGRRLLWFSFYVVSLLFWLYDILEGLKSSFCDYFN